MIKFLSLVVVVAVLVIATSLAPIKNSINNIQSGVAQQVSSEQGFRPTTMPSNNAISQIWDFLGGH
jgi:hypothetical protein